MADKAELKGRVSLNTKPYDTALRRIRRTARRWTKTVARMGRAAAKAFAAVTAIGGLGVAAIAKLANVTAKAGDAFDKLALRSGMSVEVLGEFTHIAALAGTDVGTFERALKGLSRMALDASDGLGEAKRVMDKLGLSSQELIKGSPEKSLALVIDRLHEIKSPLEQAALAQKIFGRAGMALVPVIKQGGAALRAQAEDARRLGGVFTKEAATASAQYVDQMTRLKTAIAGVRNKVVLSFLDDMSESLAKVTEKIVRLRQAGVFTTWAATAAGAVNNFVESARLGFEKLTSFLGASMVSIENAGAMAWAGLKLGAQKAWVLIQGTAELMFAKLSAGFERVKGAAKAAWAIIKGGGVTAAREAVGEAAEAASLELANGYKRFNAAMQAGAAKTAELQAEFDSLFDRWKEGTEFAEAAERSADKQKRIAEQHEAVRRNIAKWQDAGLKSEMAAAEVEKSKLGALIDQTAEMQKQKNVKGPLRGFIGIPRGLLEAMKTGKRPEPTAKQKHEQRFRSLRERSATASRNLRKSDTLPVLQQQLTTQKSMADAMGRLVKKPSLAW